MNSVSIFLSDEQRRLAEENIGLVGYALSQFGWQGISSVDDAFQIGALGLLKAAAFYDHRRAAFSTFAIACILHELWREARRQNARGRIGRETPLSLDYIVPGDERASLFESIRSDERDLLDQVAEADLVRQIVELLKRDRSMRGQIVRDYLLTDAKQHEVASRFGVAQATVSNSVRRAARRIRRILNAEEVNAHDPGKPKRKAHPALF